MPAANSSDHESQYEYKLADFSELIKGEKTVLVDFYTDWGAPCKKMTPILKLKTMMGDDITIIKIDAEKNPAAVIKYNVRGVPTLILFRKDKVLWQQAGIVQAEQLNSIKISR